jgi:hypothetical protein
MKTRLLLGTAVLACTAFIGVRLSSAPVNTEQNNQPAEDACLHAYDVCYANCKGKADVCYSNCDTAYRHCMHGAGVDFAPLKKHPIGQQFGPTGTTTVGPTAPTRKGPGKVGTTGLRQPSPSPSTSPRPILLDKKNKPTPTPKPTPKKSSH